MKSTLRAVPDAPKEPPIDVTALLRADIAKLDAETDAKKLEKIIKDADAHRVFLPDDLIVKLELAFDRNRKRIEAKEAETVK